MTQTRLPFELDQRAETAALTAHGGVPLLIEAFRTSGAAAVLDASVVIKRRKRGLGPSQLVEGLFSLWAAGGERCEDLAALREDAALALLLGHGLPAPQTVRDFLDAFDETAPPLWQGEKCQVQGEGERLQGLAKANRRLVAWQQERVAQAVATIDVDATILESHKRAALATYDGANRLSAGGGVVGGAGCDPGRRVPRRQPARRQRQPARGRAGLGSAAGRCGGGAFARRQRALRARPAALAGGAWHGLCHQRRHARRSAPTTEVGAGSQARELAAAIRALPETAWQIEREDGDAIRQWAEVAYVPSDGVSAKDRPAPPRYLALRISKKQGRLFADGGEVKHFAIVTNQLDPDGGSGLDLIRWQRGKAGTVEHAHHVLTNELAAEALPSQRFGTNAAWFRLNVLLYNLLSAFKRVALPAELHDARPKRLRFVLLNGVGKVVRHARETVLRLVGEARRKLADAARRALATGPPPLPAA